MRLKKISYGRIFRGFFLTATAISMLVLFTQCEKDPIQGWSFYLEPPPPPEIGEINTVIKNCEPPYPVTFKPTIYNVIGNINYKWDFGDTIMYDSIPTHIFSPKGPFKVKLTVSNQIGQDTMTVFLNELNKPSLPVITNFSYERMDDNSFAPNRIKFINKSSGANMFHWWFGDGNEDDAADPVHVFNSPGNFTVKLKGTCTNGTYTEYTQQVYVNPAPQRIFIDAINLMLPSNFKGSSIFIDIYHNMIHIGSTYIVSPSSYPIKLLRSTDYPNSYYFDYVQYTSNEVFKFLICRSIPDNPPEVLYEILLSSVDIRNNFYPTEYFQVETVPYIKDVFIDLYFSY